MTPTAAAVDEDYTDDTIIQERNVLLWQLTRNSPRPFWPVFQLHPSLPHVVDKTPPNLLGSCESKRGAGT